MALYDRLLRRDDQGNVVPNKIPIHQFQATVAEWVRGKITGQEANAIIASISGAGLAPDEQADVQALVNTVLSIPITGATAAQADGRARRALRIFEIDQVLLLADAHVPGYDTPTAVRAKLGV